MKKKIKKIFIIILIIIALGLIYSVIVNAVVKGSTNDQIIDIDELTSKEFDCVIVLGAGVRTDGTPSPMLEDRLLTGFAAYSELSIPIIVSGDHGTELYDEVNVMKAYLIGEGIDSNIIFMDHAGFSTYESIYRAKEIFEAKSILIVTQEYHLYRALYIANRLDIEAYGLKADIREFKNQPYYDFREYLARNKDFIKVIFKPESTYMGDIIPVSGDGDLTNDKERP